MAGLDDTEDNLELRGTHIVGADQASIRGAAMVGWVVWLDVLSTDEIT
jgi:hypothetical protein